MPHGKKGNADNIISRLPFSCRGGLRDWSSNDSPGTLRTKEHSLGQKNLEFPNPTSASDLIPKFPSALTSHRPPHRSSPPPPPRWSMTAQTRLARQRGGPSPQSACHRRMRPPPNGWSLKSFSIFRVRGQSGKGRAMRVRARRASSRWPTLGRFICLGWLIDFQIRVLAEQFTNMNSVDPKHP